MGNKINVSFTIKVNQEQFNLLNDVSNILREDKQSLYSFNKSAFLKSVIAISVLEPEMYMQMLEKVFEKHSTEYASKIDLWFNDDRKDAFLAYLKSYDNKIDKLF